MRARFPADYTICRASNHITVAIEMLYICIKYIYIYTHISVGISHRQQRYESSSSSSARPGSAHAVGLCNVNNNRSHELLTIKKKCKRTGEMCGF